MHGAACKRGPSRLRETFAGLVKRLEAEPLTTTVSDPVTGKDLKVVVLSRGALINWLRNQTYGVPTLRAAPDRIVGLAAGRRDSIEAIAKDRAARAPPSGPDVLPSATGWPSSVSCREDYPFATPEDLARGRPGSVSGLSGLGTT